MEIKRKFKWCNKEIFDDSKKEIEKFTRDGLINGLNPESISNVNSKLNSYKRYDLKEKKVLLKNKTEKQYYVYTEDKVFDQRVEIRNYLYNKTK